MSRWRIELAVIVKNAWDEACWFEKRDAYINLLKTKECIQFFPAPCSDSIRIPRIPPAEKKHYYVFPPTRWQRYTTKFLIRIFWNVKGERINREDYCLGIFALQRVCVCFQGTGWVNAQLAQSSCARCSRHPTLQLLLPDNVIAWYHVFNQQNLNELKWNDFQGQSQLFMIDSWMLQSLRDELACKKWRSRCVYLDVWHNQPVLSHSFCFWSLFTSVFFISSLVIPAFNLCIISHK